ncbi:MAG: FKBP-type peptidyl-prolyl cis-trans isomerase [Ignavibacteria bacterium]|nr:FKBP-type peptidyl-prolyl cis-trans isomerase [Ignavibacteria bacterium]
MFSRFFGFFLFAFLLVLNFTEAKSQKIKTHKDSSSYSVGYNVGKSIVNQARFDSLNLDFNLILSGFTDGILEKKPQIPETEIQKYLTELQTYIEKRRKELAEKQEKELKQQAEENLKKAQTFLEENKKKEGINETQSGLQFKVLKLGNGKKPVSTSKVKVHYKGTLIDGTVFDDSYSRGGPMEFELDKVIRGFQEGLMMMPEGSKFVFYIPPQLGYGERPVGKIPPNSLLIFEVELFEVKDMQ